MWSSTSLACGLFTIGIIFAMVSPAGLVPLWLLAGGSVMVAGIACCLLTTRVSPGPLLNAESVVTVFSKAKKIVGLLTGQATVLFLSFAFFSFLEKQTQLSPRLQRIEPGYLMQVLENQWFSLGLQPWVLCSVLGVGVAYFSVCEGRKPILSRIFTWGKKPTLRYFLQNFMTLAVSVVTMAPFVLLSAFAILWLCETVGAFFQWGSIFVNSFRSVFIVALIMVVFRKSNVALMTWMERYRVSVGTTLLIHILIFSFFFLWLNGFAVGLDLQDTTATGGVVMKSHLVGALSEKTLETRAVYLIAGWWSLWTPWLASLIARASLGFTLPRAFLHSILLPTLIFSGWLKDMSTKGLRILAEGFSALPLQVLGVSVLLLFIGICFGSMRTLNDVNRGAMLALNLPIRLSVKRWMVSINYWLSACLLGWLVLGWLPVQLIASVGGFFMLLATGLFIVAWAAWLYHREVAKRHRAQV